MGSSALGLDVWLTQAINGLAGRSVFLDLLMVKFLMLYAVKMVPLVLCIIWLWYDDARGRIRRIKIGQLLGGAFIAMLSSRLLQTFLPVRPRPMYEPTLVLNDPYGVPEDILRDWSAFPSDTAALSFAIAFGIWRVSRPIGSCALVWAALVVCLPRVFAGYHYLSDILGGALIGVFSVALAAKVPVETIAGNGMFERIKATRPLFHCLAFLVLFQVTTMFDDVRKIGDGIGRYLLGESLAQLAEKRPETELVER